MEPEKEKNERRRRDIDDEPRHQKKSKRPRSRSRSPADTRSKDSRRKRRHSGSKSPDKYVKKDRQQPNESEVKKEAPVRKNTETDMLNTRTGGAYIPPARLRMMQAQITDKSSVAYQRLAWEALKKSIHGHINKINVGNIGIIIKQLLRENIVRGRGLLCRSVIQAQAASPTFTNVYAALVAAVNSRFPNIGELLLKRLVIQFKRGFKRNDKPICISSASFIAHLVNQRVAHEILALELLTLLVESPTDDSVEVAIAFLKECGQKLTEVSSKGVNAIFEMLRNILHEGQLDKRVQYMIEVMFQVWKDGFKDHPALIEELELVPEEEQFTHLLMLDDAIDPQDILNVFKFDDKYEENEQKYKTLCKEILGSDDESDGEEGEEGSESEESDEDDEEQPEKAGGVTIIDNTETNLVALRRTIYLTINSSLDFEECAHKLMKMQLKPGQEVELCHMFLDCCAEQRTYEKFYGLLAQRFCNINRIYIGPFEEIFKDSYSTAHRLDTNRLRNVSKFFAHLLFTDSISWEVMECVRLNEEDTTSSSRIYIKILFQELAEYMGLKKLNDRLKDPTLQGAFSGIFPRDNPKNTRFSINFFTSIGLGGLTDELREHLKQLPKNVPPPVTEIKVDSDSSTDSSSSSSSSDSSSDSSSSDSEEEPKSKKKNKKSKSKDNAGDEESSKKEAEKCKDKERWGHDGFYDTYGKDARRIEPERNKRDKDNFFIPRDVPIKTDRMDANRRNRRDEREDRREERGDRRDERLDRRDERGDRRDERGDRRDESGDRRDEKGDKRDERGDRRDDRGDRRNERGDRDERGNRRDEKGDKRDERDNRRNVRDDDERRDKNDERGDIRDDRVNKKNEKGERRNEKDDERSYKRDDRGDKRNDREDRRAEQADRSYGRDDNKDEKSNKRKDKGKTREDREVDDSDKRDKNSPEDYNKSKRSDDKSRRNDKDKNSRRDVSNKRRQNEARNERKAKDTGYESDEDDRDTRRNRERSKKEKYEKENRSDRRSKRDDKNNSDSDSDDGRTKKKYDKKNEVDLNEWDIRGNSIRRETPGRYWDF